MIPRLYELNVGVETSVQPDAQNPVLPNDLVTKAYFDANATSNADFRADIEDLADGDTSLTVTYNTPRSVVGSSYGIDFILRNLVDGAGSDIASFTITAQDENGFTVIFNRINGNNHKLIYSTFEFNNP